ncbi:hypothetical protein [Vibrio phage vB_VpaP_SJSY21]|nr:hypothetical protein [Vibrio phage vB_VpaP_SJSY21]
MPKLLAREHVVEAIGEELAEYHLGLVEEGQVINYHKDIVTAFTWAQSPQGHDFWSAVYKVIPFSYVL